MLGKLLKRQPRIGLALSGGGVRALVFHLGVLSRLAREGRLSQIEVVSSVSGGSLCMGLIMAQTKYRWPSDGEYLLDVLPAIRTILTSTNLNSTLFWRGLREAKIFNSLSDSLANLFTDQWGIDAKLSDLPEKPYWLINATTHETGENWRFAHDMMGDKRIGYTLKPDFSLGRALAASSSVPVYIGGLYIDTLDYEWVTFDKKRNPQPTQPRYEQVRLWDGAVMDNLGIEGLVAAQDAGSKLNFFLVSDAERSYEQMSGGGTVRTLGRVMDIATLASSKVRLRLLESMAAKRGMAWAHVKIGANTRDMLKSAEIENIDALLADSLWMAEVQLASQMETTLRQLTKEEFDRLLQHGFETANFTLLTQTNLVSESVPYRVAVSPFAEPDSAETSPEKASSDKDPV